MRLRIPRTAALAATLMLVVSATVVLAASAPEAVDDVYQTELSTPLTVPAPGVLGNDLDADGDALSVLAVVSGPAHGSVMLNADGSFRYTPAAGYLGPDSFSYEAHDTENVSNVAEVRLNVVEPEPPEVPPCEPTVEFGGQVKAGSPTAVKAGHKLRVQVTVTCDGALVQDLSPVLALHRGSPGASPLMTAVMNEQDDKYVYNLEVPNGLRAGETLTVAVHPLGAGTPAAVATLQVRR